jgi:hypothetical protein
MVRIGGWRFDNHFSVCKTGRKQHFGGSERLRKFGFGGFSVLENAVLVGFGVYKPRLATTMSS